LSEWKPAGIHVKITLKKRNQRKKIGYLDSVREAGAARRTVPM